MKKVVLVTGGSRGIGAAISRQLAAKQWSVAVQYRQSRDEARQLCAELREQGVEAACFAVDMAEPEQIKQLFANVVTCFGHLDALVNNAGITAPLSRLETFDAARVERVFKINTIAPILCCTEAVRTMSTRYGNRGGVILNISSAAARLGSPGEYIDYAASKGAIDTLTIGLAKEVADDGIRVNAIRPGLIDTDIHASSGEPGRVERLAPFVPLLRGGRPDEVAAAAVWLLSDEASYCTGAILDVAGGR